MAFYSDFDRKHRTGCLRFIEYWNEISAGTYTTIKISPINALKTKYGDYEITIGMDNENANKFIVLIVPDGKKFYFPLIDASTTDITTKYEFNDNIVEEYLNNLFALLNNKNNFIVTIN